MLGGVSAELPFGFSTKYEDAETGLLYYGFRYYSASLGRWLAIDPIAEMGGLNIQAFVDNDPQNFFDDIGKKKNSNTGPVPPDQRSPTSYPNPPTTSPSTSPSLVSGNGNANKTGSAVVDAVEEISGGMSRLALAGLKNLARRECAQEQARRGDNCFCCHYWVFSVIYHSFFLPSSTYYHGGGGNVYRGNCNDVRQYVEGTNFMDPSFIRDPKRETQERIDFYESW